MGQPIRFLATLLLSFAVMIVFVTSAAAGGQHGKVDVCHWADHKYVEINVSENALPAHLGHGDVMPDEYGDCPGDDGNEAEDSGEDASEHGGGGGGDDAGEDD